MGNNFSALVGKCCAFGAIALTAVCGLPELATAQQRGGYYQPRIYNSPPPRYSRDAYVQGGGLAGGIAAGAAGTYYGGPYGGVVAGGVGQAAGGYYGGRMYDNQSTYTTQRYYAPPAYGVQTTTPYMTRTVPRY
jgi:hypothetical protein